MKNIFILTALLTLSGCAHERTISDIDVGMTRADVVSTLGQPNADSREGALEELTYSQRRASGWRISRHDYKVILLNDAVVQIASHS